MLFSASVKNLAVETAECPLTEGLYFIVIVSKKPSEFRHSRGLLSGNPFSRHMDACLPAGRPDYYLGHDEQACFHVSCEPQFMEIPATRKLSGVGNPSERFRISRNDGNLYRCRDRGV
jgi:hypothetical protein